MTANQTEVRPFNTPTLPILVVDDNRELRENIADLLRLEGYLVATAADGQLALEMVTLAQHCLILLDIRMPMMDGFAFLKAYTQQPAPHVSVIICSAAVDRINRADLPPFVIATLVKPFEVSRLLMLIKEYLQPA